MLLWFIPLFAILLINVLVALWVGRQRQTTRAGFFLLMNALTLILWSGGVVLYRTFREDAPQFLMLPYLAALLVPGNFLYYALTRPHPLRESWSGTPLIIVIFGPAILLTLFEYLFGDALSIAASYTLGPNDPTFDSWPQRATVLYLLILLITTLAVLGVRYYTTSGPEQNTSKHLIAVLFGPIFFALLFWASAARDIPGTIPSPGFLFALIAQGGLLVVLRQEELRNPRTLTRSVYYLTTVLIAFVVMSLIAQFYELVQGVFLIDETALVVLLGVTATLMALSRFSLIEHTFDRLFFTRAAEYRRLVAETRAELRETRDRLRRAERLSVVGEVAARVAHEIKNPLGPIRGYTQMMREKVEAAETLEDRERFLSYLEVIQEEVDNIDRRVREFLASAGEPRLALEQVDMNDMVERCARVLKLELTAGKELAGAILPVQVLTELEPGLGVVEMDPGRFEEALFNIARNAVDALLGQTRGRIVFRTASARNPAGTEGILVTVLDNGPGFDLAAMDRLFEPFYTQKDTGTGLGLAIAKATVEAHGGTIVLRNRPHGGGEVRLWMPRLAHENPGALLPKPFPTLEKPSGGA